MYLLAKSGVDRSYGNVDNNSDISFYIDTLKKAGLSVSICSIVRFVESIIPLYNTEVQDETGRKAGRYIYMTG